MSPRDSEFEEVYMSRVKNWLPRTSAAFVIGVVLVILLYAAIAYVPAGHVGVLTLFGRVTGEVLPEGTHLVNPFKSNNRLSVRTMELKEEDSVPANEGLRVTLGASV